MKKEIICDAIEIKGSVTRNEIVSKVVNTFINTESMARGSGVKFCYPVEQLPEGITLFIVRPGGLRKWNFDFKVKVTPEMGLGKGTHDEIVADLQSKKQENPREFYKLLDALSEIYNCSENDGGLVLSKYPDLQTSFQIGAKIEVLLKVVKWMFIMEDIVYWNYLGRAKLYNYLKDV